MIHWHLVVLNSRVKLNNLFIWIKQQEEYSTFKMCFWNDLKHIYGSVFFSLLILKQFSSIEKVYVFREKWVQMLLEDSLPPLIVSALELFKKKKKLLNENPIDNKPTKIY